MSPAKGARLRIPAREKSSGVPLSEPQPHVTRAVEISDGQLAPGETFHQFGFEPGLYLESMFVVIKRVLFPRRIRHPILDWAQPRYVRMAGNDDRGARLRQGQSGKRPPGGVICVRA